MKRFVVLAACVVIAGCGTVPVAPDRAAPVPAARILDASWLTPDAAKVPVTIARDKGFVGSACAMRIDVARRQVAAIEQGERVVIYLAPGLHVMQVQSVGAGLCSSGVSTVKEATVEAKLGEPVAMRISMDMQGIYFARTAF